jgi:hypothetical protein
MIQTVNLSVFRQAFKEIRPSNFSYEGLETLFNYLDEIDSEYPLDVIEICRDFTECSLDDFLNYHKKVMCNDNSTDFLKRIVIEEFLSKNGFWFDFVNDGKFVIYEN